MLTSCSQVGNYLVKIYVTEDNISEADAEENNFKRLWKNSTSSISNSICAKLSFLAHCITSTRQLEKLIECLKASIRQSIRSYCRKGQGEITTKASLTWLLLFDIQAERMDWEGRDQ